MDVKKKRGRPKGATNKNKRVKPVTPESPAAKAAKKLSQRSRLFTTPSQRRVTTYTLLVSYYLTSHSFKSF